jgi:hypothetical protein
MFRLSRIWVGVWISVGLVLTIGGREISRVVENLVECFPTQIVYEALNMINSVCIEYGNVIVFQYTLRSCAHTKRKQSM